MAHPKIPVFVQDVHTVHYEMAKALAIKWIIKYAPSLVHHMLYEGGEGLQLPLESTVHHEADGG